MKTFFPSNLSLWICVVYFLSITNLYSFSRQDSLKNILRETTDDFLRIQILNELSQDYEDSDPAEAVRLASEALNIAKWNNYTPQIIDSYTNIAFAYFYSNNYPKALENYLLAVKYLNKTSDYLQLAKTYRNISLIYKLAGFPKESIKYSELCYLNLKKQPNDDLLIDCYFDFASAYGLLENHKKEIEYLEKAIELRKEKKQWDKLGKSYNSLGEAYFKLKKYNDALNYFGEYRRLSTELGDSLNIARAFNNIGETLFYKGEYQKSAEAYREAELLKQSNVNYSYLGLANCYSQLNKPSKADYYFELARKQNADLKNTLKTCELLVEYNRHSKNFDKAFYYSDILKSLNSSLMEMSKKDVELSKPKYEVEGLEARLAEKENYELIAENSRLRSTQIQYLSIILVLILVISAGSIFIYRRKLSEQEKKSKEVKDIILQLGDCLYDIKNEITSKSS